jgi:hypothetical protein
MLFELLARTEPFPGLQLHDVAIRVRDQAANPGVPEGAPSWIVPILVKCWNAKPEQRPSFAEIIDMLDAYRPAGVGDELLAPPAYDGPSKRPSGYEYFGDNVASKGKIQKKKKGKVSEESSSSASGSSSDSDSSKGDDRYIEMN